MTVWVLGTDTFWHVFTGGTLLLDRSLVWRKQYLFVEKVAIYSVWMGNPADLDLGHKSCLGFYFLEIFKEVHKAPLFSEFMDLLYPISKYAL